MDDKGKIGKMIKTKLNEWLNGISYFPNLFVLYID